MRGIRAMLDKDVYCADILVQVAAVNAALNGFSKELLGQHIRTCVADDLKAGETQKLDELLQLLPRLMKCPRSGHPIRGKGIRNGTI